MAITAKLNGTASEFQTQDFTKQRRKTPYVASRHRRDFSHGDTPHLLWVQV